MPKSALVGLIWVCVGVVVLVLGRLMESVAARSFLRSHPNEDLDRHMKRQRLQYRVLAAAAILSGVFLLVYNLVGGRFPGE
jgi:uncharacterized membrane protein